MTHISKKLSQRSSTCNSALLDAGLSQFIAQTMPSTVFINCLCRWLQGKIESQQAYFNPSQHGERSIIVIETLPP